MYEISKLYLNKFCNGCTDGRTRTHTDKPKVGGIKKKLRPFLQLYHHHSPYQRSLARPQSMHAG